MVASSALEIEDVCCPLCGAKDRLPLFTANDRLYSLPGFFTVVQCRDCLFAYLSPRPTVQAIGHYYPPEYGPHQAPPPPHPRASFWDWLHNHLWKRPLTELYAAPPPDGSLLEIGCGSGAFLDHAQKLGWRTTGVEIDEQAASIAQQRGLNVYCGTVESLLFDQQYDLIRLSYVLEHLHHPLETLAALRQLLKPTGLVHIAVPCIDSLVACVFGTWWYDLDVPRHLCWFTPTTLQQMACRAGLRIVLMRGEITPYVFWKSLSFRLKETSLPYSIVRLALRGAETITLPLSFLIGWLLSRRLCTSRLHAILARDETQSND